VAASGRTPNGYYVVRIAVSAILDLGLTVVPDPLCDGPRGHSLIPEINSSLVGENKKRSKDLQQELAMLASGDICYSPKA
jgi:hypothetical protein